MSESEPIELSQHRPEAVKKRFEPIAIVNGQRVSGPRQKDKPRFDRRELNQILNIYGKRVAEGEWRDYAIDNLNDQAVFSIFRKTSEMPLYRIIKKPALARRQGAYSIVTPTGMVLKRGRELTNVLRVLERKPKLVPV